MKHGAILILLVLVAIAFTACEAFLEDYSYSPVGPVSSSPTY